jgi:hypothetical protein
MKNITTADRPFSYNVKVGHISLNPVEVRLEADEAERKGLATLWDVVSVEELKADLKINRWKRDGVRVRGTVTAKIVQECVVSLDPVETEINEEFEQLFVPEGSKLARVPIQPSGEMVMDPEGQDLPETFVGDTIDAGVVVAEFAAMGIDPYPRKPGLDFEDHIEDTGENDVKPSSFAALKDWKKE